MIAELKEDGVLELKVRRHLSFPREMVFDAWLKKEHLLRWMGPTADINLGFIEVDALPEGKYRFGFDDKNRPDERIYVHGKFLEVTPPARLVFTWIWEPPIPEADAVTVVTVEFLEDENGTEMILTHRKFPDDISCEKHREGWNGTLDKMETYLKQR